jgi:RNA polymerase sigma-70 factor, ECF subfamily
MRKDMYMNDQIAISRLKQGDLTGLETLVKRYQAMAVHAAYLILYDRAQAEDVAQAAFVKTAERIHQFDGKRPFAPWLYQMVVNDALKLARKQQRLVSVDAESDESVTRVAEWLVDPAQRPEQILEQEEIRRLLLQAIASLPPEQRAVIVMRYFLNMSEASMSAKMERPLSTIKWWLRDARHRLRGLMESFG